MSVETSQELHKRFGWFYFFKQQFLKTLKKKSHLFNSLMPEPALGVPGRACRITSARLQWRQGPGLVRKLRERLGGRGRRSPQIAPGMAAASCHQQRAGAQDAADIGFLGTRPSQEETCPPGRLFRSEIQCDSRNGLPGPQSHGGSFPSFLRS